MATRRGEQAVGRRSPSVRAKVLGSVVAIAALGMVVAETASYAVQSRRLDARIDGALSQELAEFRTLAEVGVDPATGRRFTSASQLLATALERNVADDNERFFGVVDGRVSVPSGPRQQPVDVGPAVLRRLAERGPGSGVQVEDVESPIGTVRFATEPVLLAGEAVGGTYVVAYAVDRERRPLVDDVRTYAAVAVASLAVLTLVGWLVAGRLLRPLQQLREAALRIDEDDVTRRVPVRGSDDVSDVAQSFNAMLDRLQAAFRTQREFLDDAGHELRTPVTIVRGHLELLDPDDPADVRETRDLVLDEVDRMGRLVEDLILLAQARRPDFVRLAPVDLGGLTDDVHGKAAALGTRRWVLDDRADVVVQADAQRLQQALLQLADNAVKHSADGVEIGIGSGVRPTGTGDEALLWVRDRGPGIAEEDRQRIFERFGRASTGRGVGGSGLGLAIVCAIAEGHDGHVELDSTLGHGSRFTLVVPVQR